MEMGNAKWAWRSKRGGKLELRAGYSGPPRGGGQCGGGGEGGVSKRKGKLPVEQVLMKLSLS